MVMVGIQSIIEKDLLIFQKDCDGDGKGNGLYGLSLHRYF